MQINHLSSINFTGLKKIKKLSKKKTHNTGLINPL